MKGLETRDGLEVEVGSTVVGAAVVGSGVCALVGAALRVGIEKVLFLALINIHYDKDVNLNQFRLREVDSTIIITNDQRSNS